MALGLTLTTLWNAQYHAHYNLNTRACLWIKHVTKLTIDEVLEYKYISLYTIYMLGLLTIFWVHMSHMKQELYKNKRDAASIKSYFGPIGTSKRADTLSAFDCDKLKDVSRFLSCVNHTFLSFMQYGIHCRIFWFDDQIWCGISTAHDSVISNTWFTTNQASKKFTGSPATYMRHLTGLVFDQLWKLWKIKYEIAYMCYENADWTLTDNFQWNAIHHFVFRKMHSKLSCTKCLPSCCGFNIWRGWSRMWQCFISRSQTAGFALPFCSLYDTL